MMWPLRRAPVGMNGIARWRQRVPRCDGCNFYVWVQMAASPYPAYKS